jgi:hypothetical protein
MEKKVDRGESIFRKISQKTRTIEEGRRRNLPRSTPLGKSRKI